MNPLFVFEMACKHIGDFELGERSTGRFETFPGAGCP